MCHLFDNILTWNLIEEAQNNRTWLVNVYGDIPQIITIIIIIQSIFLLYVYSLSGVQNRSELRCMLVFFCYFTFNCFKSDCDKLYIHFARTWWLLGLDDKNQKYYLRIKHKHQLRLQLNSQTKYGCSYRTYHIGIAYTNDDILTHTLSHPNNNTTEY